MLALPLPPALVASGSTVVGTRGGAGVVLAEVEEAAEVMAENSIFLRAVSGCTTAGDVVGALSVEVDGGGGGGGGNDEESPSLLAFFFSLAICVFGIFFGFVCGCDSGCS